MIENPWWMRGMLCDTGGQGWGSLVDEGDALRCGGTGLGVPGEGCSAGRGGGDAGGCWCIWGSWDGRVKQDISQEG